MIPAVAEPPVQDRQGSAPGIQPDDLPTWMRPRRRPRDWGLLLALAFSLVTALPLLVRENLPRDTGAELTEYRVLEVARLVRQGVFYARWAPDFVFNYGSPLFNYIAPLPHYLAGYHAALTNSQPVESVKLLTVLSILAAGCGMYAFAAGRYGSRAGLLAALAYLFSGPVALTLPYLYGDLALLMALGLLPCVAWSLDHLWRKPGRPAFLVASVTLAGFLLCDARMACFGGAVLLLVSVSGRRYSTLAAVKRAAMLVPGAAGAATALTAFFWLPAALEISSVRWLPITPAPEAGAISWLELANPPPALDAAALVYPNYRGIGLSSLTLAGLGLLTVLLSVLARRKTMSEATPAQLDSALFFSLGLILIALASPPANRLWPSPFIFQALLPYHAVLAAVFCLAVLAGQAAQLPALLARHRTAQLLFFLALCLIAPLFALPSMRSVWWLARRDASPRLALLQGELRGEHLASLRHGVLLPQAAPQIPSPLPNLAESILAGTYNPVNRQSYTGYSQIDVLNTDRLNKQFIVNTTQAFEIEFYNLYFPGWRANVGERAVSITSSPNGMILLDLPQVNGTLSVTFGGTPLRDLADMISLGAAMLLLVVMRGSQFTESDNTNSALLSPLDSIGLSLLVAFCAGLLILLMWQPDLLPSTPRTELTNATPLPRFLRGGVDMLAYSLPETAVIPGESLSVKLFWQASRPMLENNQSEVWLVEPSSRQIVARAANRHPGGIPTLRWLTDKYVRDEFALLVPPDLPPGDYLLRAAIGPCTTREPIPCGTIQGMDAFDPFGNAERGAVTIPQIIRVR